MAVDTNGVRTPRVAAVLSGCRVLVTARRRADELAAALVQRGAEVHHVPTVSMVLPADDTAIVTRTKELVARPPDVLVVTSGLGLELWLAAARQAGLTEDLLATLAGARLVARGPK